MKEPDPTINEEEAEAEKGLGRSSTPEARRSGHGIILGREGLDERCSEAADADGSGPKAKGSPDVTGSPNVDNAKSAGERCDAAICAIDGCAVAA